jgi:uncharacterized repeat protein (TIGR02543 family)
LRGDTIALSQNRPSKRGYTFLGWARTRGAQQAEFLPGSSVTSHADLLLYAVWRRNPAPVFEGGSNVTLQYRSTATLRFTTSASEAITWNSSDQSVVSVDQSGNIAGLRRGTARITATDSDGFSAACTVTVNYAWWQWLIVIFLFGWIWY